MHILGEGLGDGEAEAGARLAAGGLRGQLGELAEQLGAIGLGDAGALVNDGEMEGVCGVAVGGDLDSGMGRGKLQGVGEQVIEDAIQGIGIGLGGEVGLRGFDMEGLMFAVERGGEAALEGVERWGGGDGFEW